MEKWASKWLEMRSQIHRFYKIFRGRPPGPPNERGGQPPSHTHPPPPVAAFAARFKTSAFSDPPPTTSLGPALFFYTLSDTLKSSFNLSKM